MIDILIKQRLIFFIYIDKKEVLDFLFVGNSYWVINVGKANTTSIKYLTISCWPN